MAWSGLDCGGAKFSGLEPKPETSTDPITSRSDSERVSATIADPTKGEL